ncbi:hypothetical protein R6Q59_033956 [Mikania micrantha]|uniref:Uncharacterized protein n=1 Tax=Mikania micrantha TaxID=192012 RepID=A0A5N6NL56_9ASTR|nr:hypothetical protein E3N88_21246 [Mikania micrantha]
MERRKLMLSWLFIILFSTGIQSRLGLPSENERNEQPKSLSGLLKESHGLETVNMTDDNEEFMKRHDLVSFAKGQKGGRGSGGGTINRNPHDKSAAEAPHRLLKLIMVSCVFSFIIIS